MVNIPDSPAALRSVGGDRPKLALAAGVAANGKGSGDALTVAQLCENFSTVAQRANMSDAADGDRIRVATITASAPPERTLSRRVDGDSTRKIEAVTAPRALTAAGVCAPFVVDYSMSAIGSIERPVRDALPGFVVDRGGIQFRRDVDALGSGPTSASGTWSLQTDAAPGGALKPIADVGCDLAVQAEVAAVTSAVRLSNMTSRFDPEATAANLQAAAVAHARYAELRLLDSMYGQCTATFTAPAELGAVRDVLVALDKSSAYLRNNRRQGGDVSIRVLLPGWLLHYLRADLVRALHTSNEDYLGLADERITAWFARRGINVTWTLDGRDAVTASGSGNTAIPGMDRQYYVPVTGTQTVPAFPSTIEFPIFAEGTFLFLDGGTLDVGIVRDQSLVQTNRFIQFSESFEGVCRKGVEAIRVVQSVQPSGASAGTIDPHTLAA